MDDTQKLPEFECLQNALADLPGDGFLLIGELAARFGLDPKTVRFYQRIGLISPKKHGRLSIYDADDVRRLATIRKLRNYGMPIEGIRRIKALQGDLTFHTVPVPEVQIMMHKQLKQLEDNKRFVDEQVINLQEFVVACCPISGAEVIAGNAAFAA